MKKIKEIFVKVLSDISAIVMEAFPVLVGSSLISGFLALYKNFGGSADSTTYAILNCLGSVGTYGLPFILGYGAAKRYNANVGVALLLAVFITYPNLATIINGETAATYWFVPVYKATYTGTFFPMILTVWVQSYFEKYVTNKLPQGIRSSLGTALEAFVLSFVALVATAPIGSIIGTGIANGVLWIVDTVGEVGIIIAITLWPLLISTGAHMAFVPYMSLTMAELGVEKVVFPASIGANYTQVGACLAVALKAKTAKLRAEALSCAGSAFMIITEPALFGIDFRLKRPLIGVLCGTFATGCWLALTHTYAYQMGSVSVWNVAMWASESDPNNIIRAIIGMVIAVVVAFVATWLLGFDETEFATEEELASGKINQTGRKNK